MLQIGQKIQLEIKNSDRNKTDIYLCTIIDETEESYIINYPVHKETLKTTFFNVGTYFSAVYVGEDDAIYRFPTKITFRKKAKIPSLYITKPNEEQWSRIQRREYVRVDATIDIAVHSVLQQFEPFTTTTLDISGGGVAILAPKEVELVLSEMVDIWMPLERKYQNKIHYAYAQAEIVTIRELNIRMNVVSLHFHSITQKDRQEIIRYCFDKEREKRLKERN
ncbi:flagellar brake protein [Oceanobacillus kimchii]|uniref:flagellar brake protein n=1 Tax=Oceanobacillus kimchii TaxID=746691 RepID=UPI000985D4AD|nr:flagellar brake domain-containing protein [Oceanobacillus kimchii]